MDHCQWCATSGTLIKTPILALIKCSRSEFKWTDSIADPCCCRQTARCNHDCSWIRFSLHLYSRPTRSLARGRRDLKRARMIIEIEKNKVLALSQARHRWQTRILGCSILWWQGGNLTKMAQTQICRLITYPNESSWENCFL